MWLHVVTCAIFIIYACYTLVTCWLHVGNITITVFQVIMYTRPIHVWTYSYVMVTCRQNVEMHFFYKNVCLVHNPTCYQRVTIIIWINHEK